jgi:hypothetical protein
VKLDTLESMPSKCVAFDVETHLIRPGLLAPPLVCASAGWLDETAGQDERRAAIEEARALSHDRQVALDAILQDNQPDDVVFPLAGEDLPRLRYLARELLAPVGRYRAEILDKSRASDLFSLLLDDRSRVVAGANIAFDLLVMAAHLAREGVDAMPEIFRALMDDGRVFDVQVAEMLDAVAGGHLGKDPRTGGPIVSPETGRRGGYSLSVVTDHVLGRADAKANDSWRERYAELDGVPIARWPQAAVDYPQDDARNTAEVALAQAGHWRRAGAHRWGASVACEWCGVLPSAAYVDGKYLPCRARRCARNLHDLASQVATAFAMHLGAAWGFRVNQASVDAIERDALDGRAESEEPFVRRGLLRRNRDGSVTRDMGAICRAVALAHGGDPARACATCGGTSKVVSPKAKPVRCPICNGGKGGIAWPVRCENCQRCGGAGVVPDPRQLVNCTACAATGLDLSVAPNLPRTDTGRVGTSRDVLNESGDEVLMDFADYQEGAKTLDVYVPYLRRGRTPAAGHAPECPTRSGGDDCTCEGPWRDVPLTLWPNVLVETGRTSYRGVIQLFPRKGGHRGKSGAWVPSLRECVEARPTTLFSSEDYDSGELVTHGQSCLWICGESKLAEALLSGMKVHNALGATMIGMSYGDFQKVLDDPTHPRYTACKDARQAAKPGNFGFPGGMGPVKMVLQQRRQGPDTPHPSGPTMVRDDAGNLVPGYKGLRFCLLMDGAERCGGEGNMLHEWRDQPISPTCKRCVACAQRLKEHWLRTWPENEQYFSYINDCVEHGQLVTAEHLRLWPHLADFFVANQRLAPGEIMQHVSGRVRGAVGYCDAANGFFQGLLADLAKSALRRVARECYDRSARVPERGRPNSRPSAYAGGDSPLWGSRPIVFAHDEIILEHPEALAHDAATRTSEIMVEEMMWYCPDLARACAAEPTLMRRWYKGASAAWRDGGKKRAGPNDRLVPWEPKH